MAVKKYNLQSYFSNKKRGSAARASISEAQSFEEVTEVKRHHNAGYQSWDKPDLLRHRRSTGSWVMTLSICSRHVCADCYTAITSVKRSSIFTYLQKRSHLQL